jgi:hypothetical protein
MNLELRRDQTGGRHQVVRLLVRAVTVAALLAGLGALGGALYGALCGLMFWGTHGDVLLLLGAITRCAPAGAAAGALTGFCGTLFAGYPVAGDSRAPAEEPAKRSVAENGYQPVSSTRVWEDPSDRQELLRDTGRWREEGRGFVTPRRLGKG